MSNVFKRGWINISITMGIDSFDNYINEMENFLSNQLYELEEQFKKDTSNLDSDEAENIFEYQYEDQFYYFRNEFPNILRKSFITSLYSFLEQELNRICLHLEKNNNFEKTLDNLTNDRGIFKSYKFLSQIARVNLSTVRYEWEEIKKVNKIRNHFVHNGSDLIEEIVKYKPLDREEMRKNQTFNAFKHFNLVEEDPKFHRLLTETEILKYDIKIPSEFCKDVLSIIKKFFDELTSMLKLY
ncbi:hypothetical protein [Metabacillus idriensis]|uniref:hypothetical protein n=1 Tax=Metabacillus idriensis TaxID=324768 RepID=UPI00174C456C|nr:hypothetical protein [Metabacillus idriensis]